MNMSISKDGRNMLVKLTGDIDHHYSEEIRDEIDRDYKRYNLKNIIFDLSGVTFMDSSGIGMVIGRYKLAQKSGGVVSVSAMSLEAERIFNISGLHKIINIQQA